MSVKPAIRPAAAGDIPALLGLLEELFGVEADFSFDAAKAETALRLLLAAPAQACVLVADSGKDVVGMCSVQLVVSTAEGGPSGLLEDMVVQPGSRGQGLGRQLLAAAERWTATQGATRLQLLADKGNAPALEFYRRAGMESTRMICLRKRNIRRETA